MRPLPLIIFPLITTLATPLAHAQDATTSEQKKDAESAPNIGYTLRFGIEVGARWFVYSDPLVIATNLRPYDVVGIPLVTFGGELRPLAWTHVPIVDRIGINFDYAFASSFTSSTNSGQTITSNWDHGDLRLHVPVRLGKEFYAPQLGATLGYGWLGFNFTGDSTLTSEIPSATYRFLRFGLTGEMAVAKRLGLVVGFDYLGNVSGGNVYDRFRDAKIQGIDARLGVNVEIAKGTHISLLFDYTRYFSSFTPVPGDAYVAGGALDQFGSFKLGIDYGN